MGRRVEHRKKEYVAKTCSVTRHCDTVQSVRVQWGLSASHIGLSPDPLKLSVFCA